LLPIAATSELIADAQDVNNFHNNLHFSNKPNSSDTMTQSCGENSSELEMKKLAAEREVDSTKSQEDLRQLGTIHFYPESEIRISTRQHQV
jgi:hypothetical protein